MIPYTYSIRCRITCQSYYGCQYGKSSNPENLWKTYFTSSSKVHDLVNKYGPDAFDVKIRRTFNNPLDALLWENKVLRRIKAIHRADWLNCSYSCGPNVVFSEEIISKRTAKMLETRRKNGTYKDAARHLSDPIIRARISRAVSAARKGKASHIKGNEEFVRSLLEIWYNPTTDIADVGKIQKNGRLLTKERAFSKQYCPDGYSAGWVYKLITKKIETWNYLHQNMKS